MTPWAGFDLPMSTQNLLDRLTVGVSLVTWHPEEPAKTDWVFANQARCRLSGHTREELLAKPPFFGVSRETRAQILEVNSYIAEAGRYHMDSTVLSTTHEAVPVRMDLQLLPLADGNLLLTEYHDIRDLQRIKSQLEQVRERERHMLALVGEDKEHIEQTIRDSIGYVALPLIEQLRTTADAGQKIVLTELEQRIRDVTRALGVSPAPLLEQGLTRRQLLICEMIRDGLTSKDIAAALGCSPSTINNHRNAIRRKLGLEGNGTNLQAYLNGEPGSSV